jgi:hypothetical protein
MMLRSKESSKAIDLTGYYNIHKKDRRETCRNNWTLVIPFSIYIVPSECFSAAATRYRGLRVLGSFSHTY